MRNHPPNTKEMVELVGLIYACASNASRTSGFLGLLNEVMGGTSAQLFIRDVVTGVVVHSDMGDPAFEDANRRYARDWGPSDPRAQWLASRPTGQVLRCHEQFDKDFVQGSKFYRDFMAPHGFRWSLAARHSSAPRMDAVIVIMRGASMPPFEEWAATVLQQLLPHFERAAVVSLQLEQQAAAVRASTDMVRMLPIPCLFTDQAGRCLEGNDAFSQSLEALSLRITTGRVRFLHPELQAKWESALFEVHTTAAPATMNFVDSGRRAWTARLIPWLPVAGQSDTVDKKMILVAFHEKSLDAMPQPLPGSMASTARLTRAEVEVLAGLLKGLPAKAIATRRSASVNTVRSQIVAILEKTGFNSQKELMASFSTSVLPDSAFVTSTLDSQSHESRRGESART